MIRRLCCTGALVVAFIATSVPAAHAATVSPDKWAPKFCNAVVTYQQTISDESDNMDTALSNTTDLSAARSQIVSFLADMVKAANTAKSEIARAGSPSTTNGSKIEALFVSGLDASAKVFAKAKAKAAKISTSDPSAFAKQGKQVGVDLTNASERLGKGFQSVPKLDKGGKLTAAVKAAPECASLV